MSCATVWRMLDLESQDSWLNSRVGNFKDIFNYYKYSDVVFLAKWTNYKYLLDLSIIPPHFQPNMT